MSKKGTKEKQPASVPAPKETAPEKDWKAEAERLAEENDKLRQQLAEAIEQTANLEADLWTSQQTTQELISNRFQ